MSNRMSNFKSAERVARGRFEITSTITTAVIGYPRDRAAITPQIGARRTNHERAFCYRYHYTTIMTSRRLFCHNNPISRGRNQPIRKSEFLQFMK